MAGGTLSKALDNGEMAHFQIQEIDYLSQASK